MKDKRLTSVVNDFDTFTTTPESTKVNDDEDYGNDFLNDHENVKDDDQGKCGGTEGGGNRTHENHIGKNDIEGKVNGAEGDVNDHAYEDHIGKNNDFLNGKDDDKSDDVMMGNFGNEDDEQGNGSGCNDEEDMNLSSIIENVTKSAGLIDSQEGTENLVDGCINQKLVEDDVNDNLTGFEKNEFDDEKKKEDELTDPILFKGCAEVLVEISKAKKDGKGVVEGEGVKVDSDLGKAIEDYSNKSKDGGN
ncbi:unnamed protein product [Lactuca virosa]|uniref:Uncharacterized protein n=1 Tax=Lactuca virosa TaxID=75947 RepID=A0AAU9PX93_9ASTR|nr:unnamed protein product [Lactuca virosa]